jgi:tetratricopeptide (TPR) repeat protein
MGGASTILLGDIVVLVTGLNENNLDSLNNPLQLIDKLRSEKDFRKRIIPLITIASPGETQWSFETRHQAAKTLAGCSEPIEVPPWTGAAFRAGSIVLEPWAPETLTTAYSKLTSRIIELSKKLADEVSPGERTPSDAERRLYAAKMFLKENPEDPLAHSGYGELLLKSGRKEEGFKELRKAVKLAPENRFILERLAKHLVIDKKFKESAVLYKKLLNMTKDEAPNHANLLIAQKAVFYTAMAAQEAKDQKAYRTIKKQCEDTFSRFFPDVKWKEDLSVGEQEPYIVVQRTYARCLDLLGETEKAEEVYTALIKMFPYDWDVFQDYLTFLSRNEKYEQYERTAREAIDRGFRIFDVLALYIPFLRNRNKAKQALQYLESLRVDPGNNAVMSYLFGTLYDKLGLYEQAISFYSQSIRINPYLRDAFADLANLLLLTDRNEEAVEVATQLIDRFDNDYFGHLIRAEALTELKHYRDAIPDIKTVIGSVTGNIAFLIWAAFASEESGEIELAEKCYRLMLEIPDSDGQLRAEALAKYALLVAKHFPDRPDEAEKMIAEALKLAPALEVVAAAVSLVGLYRVKNMSQEELPSFRLIEMANFTKKTGEAQSVESDLWETLQRIKDCEGCDLETRMTAGITLAKSIIKSGDFSRGRELIAELRTKKIPGGFDSAMIDLQLSIYGMDKTKKSEETSMQDINKETKDITSGTQEPGDSD